MRKMQLGFNLMELIIAFVVLGILAAIAIPKVLDILADEQEIAAKGVATSLTAANVANYNVRKANSKKGFPVANCTDVAKTLKDGLPQGYSIMSLTIPVNAKITCTLNGPGLVKASFTATGIL